MRRISDPFQNYQYYQKFAKVILKQPSDYIEKNINLQSNAIKLPKRTFNWNFPTKS